METMNYPPPIIFVKKARYITKPLGRLATEFFSPRNKGQNYFSWLNAKQTIRDLDRN